MEVQQELLLGVPLKVIAASHTLNMAAEAAVRVLDAGWIPRAHRLYRVIGMDGLLAFLGSFGLFLAFLICAFGITAGVLSALLADALLRPGAWARTALTGISVFAGFTVAGTFVFFVFVMLVTLEMKGFLLSGFLLAAALIMEYKHQHHSSRRVSSPRMLILFSVTFISILLAVQSSYNVTNPTLIILFPFVLLLGYSTDKIAFDKPRGPVILMFLITVVLTGLTLGFSINEFYLRNPVLSETANTLNFVVYSMLLLSGLVGTIAGASTAHVWHQQEANGLSLWICGPVAVVLYNLDIGSRVGLHSLLSESLGLGGELGLITSFAVSSGFSFGLALKYAHIMLPLEVILPMIIALGLLFHYVITGVNLFLMAAAVLSLGLLSTMDGDKLVPLEDVAWDFAIMSKVMMGATVLGLAALLTWPLGNDAFSGLMLALGVVSWKAWTISGENCKETVRTRVNS